MSGLSGILGYELFKLQFKELTDFQFEMDSSKGIFHPCSFSFQLGVQIVRYHWAISHIPTIE
jgi:hypothetical protein